MDGSSNEWIPIPQEEGDLNDWLCPECNEDFDRIMKEKDFINIRPACIKCIDTVRKVFDPNYERIK
jgi:hypothetical protein